MITGECVAMMNCDRFRTRAWISDRHASCRMGESAASLGLVEDIKALSPEPVGQRRHERLAVGLLVQ
jgi:hypothetical protein